MAGLCSRARPAGTGDCSAHYTMCDCQAQQLSLRPRGRDVGGGDVGARAGSVPHQVALVTWALNTWEVRWGSLGHTANASSWGTLHAQL